MLTREIKTTHRKSGVTSYWVVETGYHTVLKARGRSQQAALNALTDMVKDNDEKTVRLIASKSPYLMTESELRRIAEFNKEETYYMKRACNHKHYHRRWTKTAKCVDCYPEEP